MTHSTCQEIIKETATEVTLKIHLDSEILWDYIQTWWQACLKLYWSGHWKCNMVIIFITYCLQEYKASPWQLKKKKRSQEYNGKKLMIIFIMIETFGQLEISLDIYILKTLGILKIRKKWQNELKMEVFSLILHRSLFV